MLAHVYNYINPKTSLAQSPGLLGRSSTCRIQQPPKRTERAALRPRSTDTPLEYVFVLTCVKPDYVGKALRMISHQRRMLLPSHIGQVTVI